MPYLLFFIYAAGACYIISRCLLTKKSGLPVRYWVLFFCVKTLAGCMYGYWYSNPGRIANSDTWHFHAEALAEYHLMFRDPQGYLLNLFHNGYGSWGGIFSSSGYWNNLKDTLMVKLVSLLNIFSGGHYYVNVVIYSFITLFGYVFYFLACRNVLKKTPSAFTTALIFLSPSCLFWTSGIHRDGIVFLFLGIFFWCCTKIYSGLPHKKHLLIIIISVAGIFAFRNYFIPALMPAFIAYLIIRRYKFKTLPVYLLTGVVCLALFFSVSSLFPSIDLPGAVIARKNAFEKLEGNSRLPGILLLPTIQSFGQNLLPAVDHAVLRPYLFKSKSIVEQVAALEMIFALLIVLTIIMQRNKNSTREIRSFQGLIVFFSLSIILLIGYTIPFAGAIVRYRAIFLMLLTSVLSLDTPVTHYIYKNVSRIFGPSAKKR